MNAPASATSTSSASTVGSSQRVVRFTSGAYGTAQRPGADDLVARACSQPAVDQVDLRGHPRGPGEAAQRPDERVHVGRGAAAGQGQVRLVPAAPARGRGTGPPGAGSGRGGQLAKPVPVPLDAGP